MMRSIGKIFDDFILDRSVYCSPATIVKYKDDCAAFFHYLEAEQLLRIQQDSFDNIADDVNIYRDYVLYLRSKKVRTVSIRSYCRSIKVFLRWCYDQDLCSDFLKGVKLPKNDARIKMPLYAAEVAAIDHCFDHRNFYRQEERDYCIFHLMLDCGLRRQEVVHLKIDDLIQDKNLIRIQDSKGNKSRIVLCPDFLFTSIAAYLSSSGRKSGYVFISLRGSDPITDNSVKMMMQRLKQRSGIQRLHAHLLRHTFATSYLIGGGNLEFLRVFLGHADYAVTKIYSSSAAQLKMLGADVYKLDPIFFTRGY